MYFWSLHVWPMHADDGKTETFGRTYGHADAKLKRLKPWKEAPGPEPDGHWGIAPDMDST